MDWEVVHRKICGKGELVRKVKWDKNKREELGKENVEDLALRMVSNPQTCLVYKKWMLETLDKMSEEDGVNWLMFGSMFMFDSCLLPISSFIFKSIYFFIVINEDDGVNWQIFGFDVALVFILISTYMHLFLGDGWTNKC